MQGTTKSGFEYKVDERIIKSWRFMDLTKKMKEGDTLEQFGALSEALEMMLGGPEEKERLLQHVEAANDGFADIEKVTEEFNEIVLSIKN